MEKKLRIRKYLFWKRKKACRIFLGMIGILCMLCFWSGNIQKAEAAEGNAKIHFLTLPENTVAVLLECNGRFGMVDSGEDSDYPDGSDPKYPQNMWIAQIDGYEEDVISYLNSVGVTTDNFDFYIGTHAHSDHIGTADEVIRAFHPKRVYLQEYSDAYISSSSKYMDNQYVYDHAIEAAKEVGAELIQDFSMEDPSSDQYPIFTLGNDMTIEIVNYGFSHTMINDANDMSLGVKVTANGKTAFLAGDINNTFGSEDVLAGQLGHVDLLCMGHHGYYGSNTPAYIDALSPNVAIIPGNFQAVSTVGARSTYMLLKEFEQKGVPVYATALYEPYIGAIVVSMDQNLSNNVPSDVNVPAWIEEKREIINYRNGFPAKTTGWVERYDKKKAFFENSEQADSSEWLWVQGKKYYADENGWIKAEGWFLEGGKWYYALRDIGWIATGWVQIDDSWFYMDKNGAMLEGGWHLIDDKYYYMLSHGAIATDTWIDDCYVDELGVWREEYAPKHWVNDGGKWWYRHDDGSYTVSGWEEIDENWYYFDEGGWMQTGWLNQNNAWYYLSESGAMLSEGWHWIDGSCYYMYPSGQMAVNGWIQKSYVGASGAWIPNYSIGQWMQTGNLWWYLYDAGGFPAEKWEIIGGDWYYFDKNGWMQTGWKYVKDAWYYFGENGVMLSEGWHWIDGSCYYMNESGKMMTNTWIDGYYINESGVWVS